MNRLLASIVFFTRIPLWKIRTIPAEDFRHIVARWSICGWITGGTMALTFLLFHEIATVNVAVAAALIARVLLTGGLHEDGMADFFDGFGGGHDRESILRIMKDSHIGSYGVLGLVLYYLMSYTLFTALPPSHIPILMLVADAFCKFVSSFIITVLPYARKEQESKAKIIYTRLTPYEVILSATGGLLPLFWLPSCWYLPAIAMPLLTFGIIWLLLKNRLQGYTGDCCGAMFLLTELSMRTGLVIMFHLFILQ